MARPNSIETWREWSRTQHRVYARRTYYERTYGLTNEQLVQLLHRQGGRCQICRQSFVRGRALRKTFYVDHCHKTQRVRGLLCPRCNTAIGLLGDNGRLFARAAGYVGVTDSTPPDFCNQAIPVSDCKDAFYGFGSTSLRLLTENTAPC